MKNYYSSNKWDTGDGWYLIGDGNPYMNDFQHEGTIVHGGQILFPFEFIISSLYDVNLIYDRDRK